VTENPDLFLAEQAGHEYRCFFPVGTDAGNEALAHNSAIGHTATGTPVSIHGSAAEAELVV
jgi:peptide/nickel transport system ATP-binding protein